MNRMFERWWISVVPMLALFVTHLTLAAPPDPTEKARPYRAGRPQPALWAVKEPSVRHVVMYLFGSIHFGNEAMYPLPEFVRDAFARSSSLVVEININAIDPARAAAAVVKYGMRPVGDRLRSSLHPHTWQRLAATSTRLGVSADTLDKRRLWLVSTLLTAAAMRSLGFTESYGVDRHFLDRASPREVIELETPEEQLAIFERISPADSRRFLEHTLNELDEGSTYLSSLIEAWRRGAAQRLDDLVNRQTEPTGFTLRTHERLIADRNLRMVAKLHSLAEQQPGATFFVVVGAGHMLGETGLVRGLSVHVLDVERVHQSRHDRQHRQHQK